MRPASRVIREGGLLGVVSLKKSVEKVLSQKINYEVDGKTGRVSRLEALLTEHAIMGIKGDVRSAVPRPQLRCQGPYSKGNRSNSTTPRHHAQRSRLGNYLRASTISASRART